MPTMFKYYLSSVVKSTVKAQRKEKLLDGGFLPWELSRGAKGSKLYNLAFTTNGKINPGFQRMRAARAKFYADFQREAKRHDWDRTKALKLYRARVDKLYARKRTWAGSKHTDWLTIDGKKSPWAMYRWFNETKNGGLTVADFDERDPSPTGLGSRKHQVVTARWAKGLVTRR